MLEKLLPFIMMGLFAGVFQPPITEMGLSGGPYWPDIDLEADICRDHLTLRDFAVEFSLFDSRQMRF